ncbi:DUF6542 domain-containing protein [Corynebacterium sp. H127]|uniref:DUF6542 domain-containing protein n=1 Tax=Corynebacterium sp. H127 TaxID=3133418 RepID=UPI0030B449F0
MPQPTATAAPANRHQAPARVSGLPIWTALSICVAACLTGLLLSISAGELAWPFILCFGLAAIATAVFVRLDNVFNIVAVQPLLFGIFTPITAWIVAKGNISGDSDPWSKTMILSAVYPLAMFFPALAGISLACIAVAWWRINRAKLKYKQDVARLERQRKSAARREQRNRQTVTRVREMNRRPRRSEDSGTQRVPFSQLIKDVDTRAERQRFAREARDAQRERSYRASAARSKSGSANPERSQLPRIDRAQRPQQKSAPRRNEKPTGRPSLSDDLYS